MYFEVFDNDAISWSHDDGAYIQPYSAIVVLLLLCVVNLMGASMVCVCLCRLIFCYRIRRKCDGHVNGVCVCDVVQVQPGVDPPLAEIPGLHQELGGAEPPR